MAWGAFNTGVLSVKGGEVHACSCIGPQNGDPVCPCQMPGYLHAQAANEALKREMRRANRVRVPCGRRVV